MLSPLQYIQATLCTSEKTKKTSLLEEFYDKYYEGVFYNSTQEKDFKIIATLYIDNNGKATISSLESLINNQEQNEKITFIYGYISNNDSSKNFSIKLFDLYQSYVSYSTLNKYKYISFNFYISENIDRDICNCKKYNSLMLSSKEINDWVTITGFDYKISTNKVFEVNHLYKQPKSIKLFKNDEYKIDLFFRANTSQPIKRKSSISEEVFLVIDTKRK